MFGRRWHFSTSLLVSIFVHSISGGAHIPMVVSPTPGTQKALGFLSIHVTSVERFFYLKSPRKTPEKNQKKRATRKIKETFHSFHGKNILLKFLGKYHDVSFHGKSESQTLLRIQGETPWARFVFVNFMRVQLCAGFGGKGNLETLPWSRYLIYSMYGQSIYLHLGSLGGKCR